MADFSIAYAPLAGFEGGWCNVQGDSGGETGDNLILSLEVRQ